uniref:Uncharacterized protein n=1 Tax=viral metagenome TaxID=1070528 RepID=A0A6M3LDM6_9ZZZZ
MIEFEGKTVIPKNGIYRCPFHCGANGYPQPIWKTETGFRRHMPKCPKRPSLLEAMRRDENAKIKADECRRDNDLSKVTQNIGDTIHFVRTITVKPTHEQRGNRMVRVRYEPQLRYESGTTRIESINWLSSRGVYFNHGIFLSDLYTSADEAKTKAAEMQASWDEHVRTSEMCR